MYCNVCQRETPPINIGGENYCSNCGTKLAENSAAPASTPAAASTPAPTPAAHASTSATAKPVAAAPIRRVTDLSPRLSSPAPTPPAPGSAAAPAAAGSATQSTTQPAPQHATIEHPPAPDVPKAAAPKPAAALHTRAKPAAHLLDLRPSPEAAATTHEAPVVHEHNHTPATPPKSTAHERHIAQFTDRFDHAKQYDRSPHVSRFADGKGHLTLQALTTTDLTPPELRPTDEAIGTPHHPRATHESAAHTQGPTLSPARELPNIVATQHQAMANLTRMPQPKHQPEHNPEHKQGGDPAKPAWRPHLSLTPGTNRVMAISAAVAILGGYIWVQNYPKLALQAASNRAGLTASLPGYIPSSYNLGRTDTAPGLVTLNFTSPSIPDILKIAQARSDWDSSSLLDNFIIKNTDDYTTVQGQGLTIYLFNNNQAAWINHGIRYSIEGAARLSREQILKIAYSL